MARVSDHTYTTCKINTKRMDGKMALSKEDREFLDRITSYANEVMPDLEPQKTQVSVQLDKMMPIFEEIAREQNAAVEDIFIKYMDLANEAFEESDRKMQEALADLKDNNSVFRFD